MSPEILNQAKNLFLIFPPGCGGNHLANLLSLCPVFEPRIEHANYVDNMISMYETKFNSELNPDLGSTIAHFGYLENLQKEHLTKHWNWLMNSSRVNILCSHLYEYLFFDEESRLYGGGISGLDKRIFGICSFPKDGSLAHTRVMTGPWINGEITDQPHSKLLYNKSALANGVRLYNSPTPSTIPYDRAFEIDTDLFFTEYGFDHVQTVCNIEMGISLPELGKYLHMLWLSNITRVCSIA